MIAFGKKKRPPQLQCSEIKVKKNALGNNKHIKIENRSLHKQ